MNIFLQQGQTPSAPAEAEAPPPYTTLPREPGEVCGSPWIGPGSGAGVGYAPRGVKLGHSDFVPRVVERRTFGPDRYETFEMLVQRANEWLEDHNGLSVISCESVTWTGTRRKNIFSDSALFARSMHANVKTKHLRGLRLWYLSEVFPDATPRARMAVVCRTYVPGRGERFDQLVNRANDDLEKNDVGGHILSVEAIRCLYPQSINTYSPRFVLANRTFWRDYPDTNKRYVICLRVYAMFGHETVGKETIGYQDFVPEYNRRNQENGGFEVFSDIMQKASQWLARQQGVRFTNLQTIPIKLKKKGPFEERCVYREHLCANNRLNVFKGPSRTTHYVKLIRSFFVMQTGADLPVTARLTYRTFTPAHLASTSTRSHGEYEGMRQLTDRVNQWLQITGAKVFCMETVPIRITTGNLQLLGPEATYSRNSSSSPSTERWLYHIRIYLDGEYIEPPGAVSLVVPSVTRMV